MFSGKFPLDHGSKVTLEQSLERERLIAKIAQLGIWEYEVGTEKVYLDDRSCEIYGVDRAEFGGTVEAWIALLHPEDRDATARRMLRFRNSTEKMLSTTFRVLSPNSGLRFIHLDAHTERDENAKPQRMFGVVRDVTDQRTFEQEIQDRVQYTQSVIDSVFDSIVVIDTSGVITSFNPASEMVFGRKSEDVIGQNVSILMPKSFADNHDHYLSRYLSGAEPLVVGRIRELEGIRKNGEVFPMELAVTEFHQGGERGFVGVIRDRTEQKRLERMKAEFVATISHELRTPLTSISGALGLLRSGVAGPNSERGTKLLDTALRNSQRLARLIEDLLDMERLTVDQLDFDLAVHPIKSLLNQALDSNDAYAGLRDITLELKNPVPEVSIRVDDGRFVQILSNFLSNAVKFSPEGERVSVEVTLDDDDLICTVTDNGPGIPDTFRDQMFQRFSQADSSDTRNTSGAGLGLAISKELAINMNGSVGYEPAPHGGARFWVRFPVVSDAPESHRS